MARLTRHEIVQKNQAGEDLCNADCSYADLRGVTMENANFRGADLYNANLRRVYLIGDTDLRDTDLRGVNFCYVNLRRADLGGADLHSATYNKFTIWPRNFDPEAAGAILVIE